MNDQPPKPNVIKRINEWLKEHEPLWALPLQVIQTLGGIGVLVAFVYWAYHSAVWLLFASMDIAAGVWPYVLVSLPGYVLGNLALIFKHWQRSDRSKKFMRKLAAHKARRLKRRVTPVGIFWPQVVLCGTMMLLCFMLCVTPFLSGADVALMKRIDLLNARVNDLVKASKEGKAVELEAVENIRDEVPMREHVLLDTVFITSNGLAACTWAWCLLIVILKMVTMMIGYQIDGERVRQQRAAQQHASS